MNGFVRSSFQVTQFRFTLFKSILDANNKGFTGLQLLITLLIKPVIRTISRLLRPSAPRTTLCGGGPSRGRLFLYSCNLIGSQMDDLRFFITSG